MPHFPPIVLAIAFATVVVAVTAIARRLPVPPPSLRDFNANVVGVLSLILSSLILVAVAQCELRTARRRGDGPACRV